MYKHIGTKRTPHNASVTSHMNTFKRAEKTFWPTKVKAYMQKLNDVESYKKRAKQENEIETNKVAIWPWR